MAGAAVEVALTGVSAPELGRVMTSFAEPVAFAVLQWQRGFEEWQSSGWRGATGVEFASQDGASSGLALL